MPAYDASITSILEFQALLSLRMCNLSVAIVILLCICIAMMPY